PSPGVRTVRTGATTYPPTSVLFLEGLLPSEDIDLVVALAKQRSSSEPLNRPWQEQPVAEVMHPATIRITPTTSVAAAAQLLVERGLNSLPVVEYEQVEQRGEQATEQDSRTILVGLLTRSDLL